MSFNPVATIVGQIPERTQSMCDTRKDVAPLQPTKAPTLAGMAKDYSFFTPALLAIGGFDRDPVAEFAKVRDDTLKDWLLVFDFDKPVFPDLQLHTFHTEYGQQQVDYRRRLYAAPNEKWEPLRDFLSWLTWYRTGFAAMSGFNQITVPDLTNLHCDSISVYCFIAQTTVGTILMGNITGDPFPRPQFVHTHESVLARIKWLVTETEELS